MNITSAAFENGQVVPRKHTCQGDDASPALLWNDVPAGAKSLALICNDPDAPVGDWVHWVIYNLPTSLNGLPEGVPPTETLPNGAHQGLNDFRRSGYGGPCPPPGKPHRYFFTLYALDATLPPKEHATRRDFMRAIQGHVLAEAKVMGTYKRH
jgi:Raf kinase inhibitor-like YbhB/YbcL family protein